MGNDGLFSICLSLKWAICGTYYNLHWKLVCFFFFYVCWYWTSMLKLISFGWQSAMIQSPSWSRLALFPISCNIIWNQQVPFDQSVWVYWVGSLKEQFLLGRNVRKYIFYLYKLSHSSYHNEALCRIQKKYIENLDPF
jgi:hypothetical protein